MAAAGKGVIIAETDAQARAAVDDIFDGAFGEAGAELVIEEFMTGVEASFVLTDGTHAIPLATAQDHKRVGEGDTGLNTGGMGAYSPAKIVTPTLLEETMTRIIQPTLTAMADKGTPYRGVLYAGLMLTEDEPKLVEYNARFGDPECQVLMLRLKSDLVPALLATAQGDISSLDLEWYDEYAMTVVMAARVILVAILKAHRLITFTRRCGHRHTNLSCRHKNREWKNACSWWTCLMSP